MKQRTLYPPKPWVTKTFRGVAEIVCWCGFGMTFKFPFHEYPVVPATAYSMSADCPDCGYTLVVHWEGDELM